jgi:nitrite reductase (NADH) small subunit
MNAPNPSEAHPRLVKAGAESEFPVGKMIVVEIERREIGVIRLRNGELRAILNRCPHKGAPVCKGLFGGTWLPTTQPGQLEYGRDGEVLVCPWHGFEFDLLTGAELYWTPPSQLRTFPVVVRDGDVLIGL